MNQFSKVVKSSFAEKLFVATVAALLVLTPAVSPLAYGQSASSAQAYYGSSQNGVNIADMFSPTLLFSGQLKTSNVGSILAGVSMECALWTYTSTTATSGGGKNSSSARATVKVTVRLMAIPWSPAMWSIVTGSKLWESP